MDIEMLQVDKKSPTPAYLQLKEQLSRAITHGRITAGEALPSERELAESLGLARMTVRRTFELLVADNLVEQRQGSGTYVLPRRLEQVVDRVLGFTDEAKALGFRAGSTLLEAGPMPTETEVAKALRLEPGSEILRITRLRTADGFPLAIQISHLVEPYTGLSLERLLALGSLYKALEADYGIYPHHARQVVSARLPSRGERLRLEMRPNVPVLALTRITFDEQGRAFEFVRSAYRGDKYQLALDLRSA